MSKTIIDLIRHGEPEGGSRYRGHKIDDPLSQKGWQQMRKAIGNENCWQQIISSPLLRCRDFAEQLANKHVIPLHIKNELKEIGFGSWEGLTREQVKQKNIKEYTGFYADPVHNRPDGSENIHVFINRVIQCYQEIIKQFKSQHILIVAHAGVIRAILAHSVHAPPQGMYNFKINNAGIARIQLRPTETDIMLSEIAFINQSFHS